MKHIVGLILLIAFLVWCVAGAEAQTDVVIFKHNQATPIEQQIIAAKSLAKVSEIESVPAPVRYFILF